jgi:hypothetical protein
MTKRASSKRRSLKNHRLAQSNELSSVEGDAPSGKLALFGWLRGTVVINGDLTEPADPEWAKRVKAKRPAAD